MIEEGNIVLINDDCLKIMNDKSFFDNLVNPIIVTDPPFNIKYHYHEYEDNKDEKTYYEWLSSIFNLCPFVVIHYPENIYKISHYTNKFPNRVISWVYNSNTARQHRDIAFFNVKPNFKQVLQPYKNQNDKRIQERIKNGKIGCKLYDWFYSNQVKNVSKDKTLHPCQMPIDVMNNIIGLLPEKCTIIDPFMGSGTTGIAVNNMNIAQNAERKFIGIEMDNLYYNISKERIIDKI